MMRLKLFILSFVVLFMISAAIIALPYVLHHDFIAQISLISQDRGFTKEEAKAKIGRRVRVVNCSSLKLIGKRKDDPEGRWMDLVIGEKGTVRRMEKIAPNEYFLIVYWDKPKGKYPYRSYYRKSGQFSVYHECLAQE